MFYMYYLTKSWNVSFIPERFAGWSGRYYSRLRIGHADWRDRYRRVGRCGCGYID